MLLSWPAKVAVLALFFGYLAVSIVGKCRPQVKRSFKRPLCNSLEHCLQT